MNIKHNLPLILLVIPLMLGCVQRQAATYIGPGPDSTATAVEQLPTVTVEVLKGRIDAGMATFILDVRTPEEYDGPLGHIEGSHLIPVQELARRVGELSEVKDQPIFVICRGGGRSARATRMLLGLGYEAVNVAGGMRAWNVLVAK